MRHLSTRSVVSFVYNSAPPGAALVPDPVPASSAPVSVSVASSVDFGGAKVWLKISECKSSKHRKDFGEENGIHKCPRFIQRKYRREASVSHRQKEAAGEDAARSASA